jgi:small subunit ribosomal protein S13
MARIAGVDLPNNKRIDIALQSIYGVGRLVSRRIVEAAHLDPVMKAGDLDPNQVNEIRKALDEYTVEGDLRREVALNIKRLVDLGCYRGIRHRRCAVSVRRRMRAPGRGRGRRSRARRKRRPPSK